MAFLLLHIYLYAHAVGYATLVVDVTEMARSDDYMRSMTTAIQQHTLLDVRLDSVSSKFEFLLWSPADLTEMREGLNAGMQLMQSLSPLSEAQQKFAFGLADCFLTELANYQFYAGKITRIFGELSHCRQSTTIKHPAPSSAGEDG
jgi:hypothetical protein